MIPLIYLDQKSFVLVLLKMAVKPKIFKRRPGRQLQETFQKKKKKKILKLNEIDVAFIAAFIDCSDTKTVKKIVNGLLLLCYKNTG